MPRLFVAVDLAETQRAQLAALIDEATRVTPISGARWATGAQLHVTVRFLGSVAEDGVAQVRAALAQVRADSFALALAGVGAFPEPPARKPARVLWVGLQPVQPLRALKAAVDAVLGPDAESAERGYTPHVTLARAPGMAPSERDAFLARHAALASAPAAVARFCLYESKTLPTGAVYQVIEAYPLR